MTRKAEEMRYLSRQNLRGGDGEIGTLFLIEKDEMMDKADLCAILTVNPGCSIGRHPHDPEAEIFYVLEGEVQYFDNGEEVPMRAGDACFDGNGQIHGVRNITDKPARLLAVIIK